LTISAERAAGQVITACRRGEAELVITVPARMAMLAHVLAPELFSGVITLVNRLLPPATGREGDEARRGRDTGSQWATSGLMRPTYAAAQRNNEL
jgi:hypothetical protein